MKDEFAQLRLEFIKDIPNIANIIRKKTEEILDDLKQNKTPDWKELLFLTHRLAGSSGIHKFHELSDCCGYMEEILEQNKLQNTPTSCAVSHLSFWFKEFTELTTEVAMDKPAHKNSPELLKELEENFEKLKNPKRDAA